MSLDLYRTQFPDLPFKIVSFFNLESKNNVAIKKTVFECCSNLKAQYGSTSMPQPRIIDQICQILSRNGNMSCIYQGGMDGTQNQYMSIRKSGINDDLLSEYLNCVVYGFKYILAQYQSATLAIKYIKHDETQSLGTGFLLHNYLITAKHCLEGSKSIQIDGITKHTLDNSEVWYHSNMDIDLAVIKLPTMPSRYFRIQGQAEPLDDIVTFGYPKLPGFHNFLAVEKSQISSRFRLSTGSIVAKGFDIWTKKDLLLISAKIQGGNSGGPVIRSTGEVVGVAVRINFGEGDNYDQLGYGTAIPIEYAWQEMIIDKQYTESTNQITFEDFE